ncbi:hypothetical protein Tco_1446818 [Tanacetum coccineum]
MALWVEKICKKNVSNARSLLLMALQINISLPLTVCDANLCLLVLKHALGELMLPKKTQMAIIEAANTSPEDLNVKFLRSLPSEWDTHVVVWMNKPDFETMGLDDLYNNFKIVEQKKDGSKVEKIWLVGMRARKFYQRTGRKDCFDGSSTAGYDKSNGRMFQCHKMGHFARECGVPKKKRQQKLEPGNHQQQSKDEDALKRQCDCFVEKSVGHKDYLMGLVKTELEKVKEEKEGVEYKLAKFEKSSKDLDALLASQVTDKNKRGFGYNAVPSPHPLILNRPTPLDLSYSESNNSKENTDDLLTQKSKSVTETSSVVPTLKVDKKWKEKLFNQANNVRLEEPKEARENMDAPIIEDWVSDDEEEVESIPKEEKKVQRPEGIKEVGMYDCPNAYKHMIPRAVLMRTGLKTVKNAKPLSTARPILTFIIKTKAFYKNTALNKEAIQLNEKDLWIVDAQGHMSGNIAHSQISKNMMEDLLVWWRSKWRMNHYTPQSVDDVLLQGHDGEYDVVAFQDDGFDDHQVNTASPQRQCKRNFYSSSIQNVWFLVDLPKGLRVLSTTMGYRNKKDERGIVIYVEVIIFGITKKECVKSLRSYEIYDWIFDVSYSIRPDIMFAVCACAAMLVQEQIVVGHFTNEAEYVGCCNCVGQVL